jgi:lipoate-protein ligase A
VYNNNLSIEQKPAQAGHILMARDAELLKRASQGLQEPVVRFYEWIQPTVSLGFHQPETTLDIAALEREVIPWVRRPTGGAAVLHSRELTYAIALSPLHPWQKHKSASEHIGRALARGLRALGVEADVLQRGRPLGKLPDRASCFVRASRWEVCARGKKIIGSAQRMLQGALLQHGSILCTPAHLHLVSLLNLPSQKIRDELLFRLKNASTSIEEELNCPVSMTHLRQKMEEAFREEFNESCEGQFTETLESQQTP